MDRLRRRLQNLSDEPFQLEELADLVNSDTLVPPKGAEEKKEEVPVDDLMEEKESMDEQYTLEDEDGDELVTLEEPSQNYPEDFIEKC